MPEDSDAYNDIGTDRWEAGNFAGALAAYKQALTSDPWCD
jgi:hypothetical protein